MLSKTEIAVEITNGQTVRFESGRMAKQAHGAAVVQMGDNVLLATMCVGGESTMGFFPLTVEYREKAYAAGKIPGGYFKREAKPTDAEVLTARLIDRPIRPMFPEGFMRETQVILNVLSADSSFAGDVLGVSAASLAVGLSHIPFEEQVAAVRVIKTGDEIKVNPTFEETEAADLEMVLAGTASSVTMVEGGAWEVPESDLIAAIQEGHKVIKTLCEAQQQLIDQIGKEKIEFVAEPVDQELYDKVKSLVQEKLVETFHVDMVKSQHYPAMDAIKEELLAQFDEDFLAENAGKIKSYFGDIERDEMRKMILAEGRRIDGRNPTDIRPIEIQTSVLPSTHGSALFQRGETQGLATVTLGTKSDEQRIDSLQGETFKNYMLHYNFPPFSVGEAKRVGSVSRREVGHGHLAERSLAPVLPHPEDFPYTIRIVSEILESNGSSSMASVCGGALSLMDAGIPIKAPVAGIAMGLISEGDDVQILSDITGTEDHLGDMDFKITGTREGITCFQMDIKIKGITPELMGKALDQARAGRDHILSCMEAELSAPREELNINAPSIETMSIKPAKIKEVIGPGGNVIRGIQSATGTDLNIDDDGTITISAPTRKAGQVARKMVEEIVAEAEVDKLYHGKVKGIKPFGAFVEFLPNQEGLVHISELDEGKTEKVEDICNVGDELDVVCIGFDPRGKVKLSRKAALKRQENSDNNE